MFQDEAGFGRINTPKYCWCEEGYRPSVPCHHIREYVYAYGAVDPIDGDDFFLGLYTQSIPEFPKLLPEQILSPKTAKSSFQRPP